MSTKYSCDWQVFPLNRVTYQAINVIISSYEVCNNYVCFCLFVCLLSRMIVVIFFSLIKSKKIFHLLLNKSELVK